MKASKFKNTYKCSGSISIYKKETQENRPYAFEYFEIKNIILTDENVFEIFEDKLKYIASNEIKLIGEENIRYWTYQISSIKNNNS
tara:strand:- start:297 stop:554 length:258 start_codon:yes stop_codon:yes gene_type:complete